MKGKQVNKYLGLTIMNLNLKKEYRLLRDLLPPNIQ